MEHFTPLASLLGGALIGLGASLLLLLNGRIAGVSGILGGVLRPAPGDVLWRTTFLLGLVGAGAVAARVRPAAFAAGPDRSVLTVAIAGLLVGFGTRLGSGCTSGHGVCGMSRLSPRSLVATVSFIATGALTVYFMRHVFGGSP